MVNLFLIRIKKKLYYPFVIDDKNKLIKYLKNELDEWNILLYSTEDNKFYPKSKLSVFLHFFYSPRLSNISNVIFKPADTIFFVRYFHLRIKETKKGNYLYISVNFQNLIYFVIVLFLSNLIIFFLQSYKNINLLEILGISYCLTIGFIIFSIFYIKLSLKVIFKYIDKLIWKYKHVTNGN